MQATKNMAIEKRNEILKEMQYYIQESMENGGMSSSTTFKKLEKRVQSYLSIENLASLTWEDATVLEKVFAQYLGESAAQMIIEDNRQSEKLLKVKVDGEYVTQGPVWKEALNQFGKLGSLLRPKIFEQAINKFIQTTSNSFIAWHEGYQKEIFSDNSNTVQNTFYKREALKSNPLKEEVFRSILNTMASGLSEDAKDDHTRLLEGMFARSYHKPLNEPAKGFLAKSWIMQQITKLSQSQNDSKEKDKFKP